MMRMSISVSVSVYTHNCTQWLEWRRSYFSFGVWHRHGGLVLILRLPELKRGKFCRCVYTEDSEGGGALNYSRIDGCH